MRSAQVPALNKLAIERSGARIWPPRRDSSPQLGFGAGDGAVFQGARGGGAEEEEGQQAGDGREGQETQPQRSRLGRKPSPGLRPPTSTGVRSHGTGDSTLTQPSPIGQGGRRPPARGGGWHVLKSVARASCTCGPASDPAITPDVDQVGILTRCRPLHHAGCTCRAGWFFLRPFSQAASLGYRRVARSVLHGYRPAGAPAESRSTAVAPGGGRRPQWRAPPAGSHCERS